MYPNNIQAIHIELTDKCQAACPMCMRNYFGGADRDIIKNVEITLDNVKQWFPKEFLSNLKSFYACGSLGDPVVAKDCLEIFRYLKDNTTDCRLAIHTNGSLRTTEWWTDLADALGPNGVVVFAIDGFKGEHEIYRRGTSWDKIIDNAKAFIAAGGQARADCLIFEHNEDRIEELKEYLLSIGFQDVLLKPTDRFYGDGTFPVHDRKGNLEYTIKPPSNSKWVNKMVVPKIEELAQEIKFHKTITDATINPKCVEKSEIYIDARGNVYPCCWTGTIIAPPIDTVSPELTILRDKLSKSTHALMNDIGVLDLHTCTNIIDLLQESKWDVNLPKHWSEEKKFVCVKQCATNWKQLVE